MAIPTQFSVTKKRKCPLANPIAPPDGARVINAESVGFVSGASNIPAKDSVDISTPVTVTTVAPSATELPSLFGSLSAPDVDDAVVITSKATPDVDEATVIAAEMVADINSADVITAEVAADIDSASALTAETAPDVDSATTITAKTPASIDDASLINAESVPSISTPTALTASAGTQTSGTFPLNHARILYDNLLFGYSAISSSEGTPINALTPHTGDRWYFDSSATTSAILITLQDAVDMDTICICAHNIGSIIGTVSLTYSSDGVAFVDWTPDFSPSTDAAIMQHVSAPRQVKAIRVQINSGAEATGFIGYISAGLALQMQRPFFNGHQPYTDSDVTEYYNAKSEAGNILNRDVRRKGFEASYEWSNIDDGWYRAYIPDLKEKAKKQPMVLAWNLLEYPDDVAFGMTTADIKAPMQNGTVTKRGGFGFTLVGV